MFRSKVALQVKGHDSLVHYIHEDDLASAIRLVLQKRAHGIYHITSDDSMRVSEMMRRTGMRAQEVPRKFLERFADVGFALGFAPVSGHWIRMF